MLRALCHDPSSEWITYETFTCSFLTFLVAHHMISDTTMFQLHISGAPWMIWLRGDSGSLDQIHLNRSTERPQKFTPLVKNPVDQSQRTIDFCRRCGKSKVALFVWPYCHAPPLPIGIITRYSNISYTFAIAHQPIVCVDVNLQWRRTCGKSQSDSDIFVTIRTEHTGFYKVLSTVKLLKYNGI